MDMRFLKLFVALLALLPTELLANNSVEPVSSSALSDYGVWAMLGMGAVALAVARSFVRTQQK